jgi:opacity protein-like surface antigen
MAISLAKLVQRSILCACASLSLAAEGPRLGVQALGSWPTGSMRTQFTDQGGAGLGVFAEWEVDSNRTMRLAYDGVLYPNQRDTRPMANLGAVNVLSTDNNRKGHSNALTLQYLYFPGPEAEGLYLVAGLGAMKMHQKIDSTVRLADTSVMDLSLSEDTGVKLACIAGLGYEFGRNWGVSARYSFITVDNHTLGAAQAAVSYRF